MQSFCVLGIPQVQRNPANWSKTPSNLLLPSWESCYLGVNCAVCSVSLLQELAACSQIICLPVVSLSKWRSVTEIIRL